MPIAARWPCSCAKASPGARSSAKAAITAAQASIAVRTSASSEPMYVVLVASASVTIWYSWPVTQSIMPARPGERAVGLRDDARVDLRQDVRQSAVADAAGVDGAHGPPPSNPVKSV
jgi:hypothetical protein